MADNNRNFDARNLESMKQRDDRLHAQRLEADRLRHTHDLERDRLRYAHDLTRDKLQHEHDLARTAAYAQRDQVEMAAFAQIVLPFLKDIGVGVVTLARLASDDQRAKNDHELALAKEAPEVAKAKLEHQADMAKLRLEHSAKMNELAVGIFSSPTAERLCNIFGAVVAHVMATEAAAKTKRKIEANQVDEVEVDDGGDDNGEVDDTGEAEDFDIDAGHVDVPLAANGTAKAPATVPSTTSL